MASVSFSKCSVFVDKPENKLSSGVDDPGKAYMDLAYEILQGVAICLADSGELPNVEDVAYQIKEAFHACGH